MISQDDTDPSECIDHGTVQAGPRFAICGINRISLCLRTLKFNARIASCSNRVLMDSRAVRLIRSVTECYRRYRSGSFHIVRIYNLIRSSTESDRAVTSRVEEPYVIFSCSAHWNKWAFLRRTFILASFDGDGLQNTLRNSQAKSWINKDCKF